MKGTNAVKKNENLAKKQKKMFFSSSRGLLISFIALFIHYLLIIMYSAMEIYLRVDIPFFATYPDMTSVVIVLLLTGATYLVPQNFLIGFSVEAILSKFFMYPSDIRQIKKTLVIARTLIIVAFISIFMDIILAVLTNPLGKLLTISFLSRMILSEIFLYVIFKALVMGVIWWMTTRKYGILVPAGIVVNIW